HRVRSCARCRREHPSPVVPAGRNPMSQPSARTALVTGASSGIGRAVTAALVDRGYRVVGTSRRPETIADPVPGVEYVALDLADDASVDACADRVGAVDVLVNNAGESQSGPFEELPSAAV